MTVDLPPQIARIVQDAVLSGHYRTPEEVLTEAVSCWQERQKMYGLSLGGMTIKGLRDEARP